MSLLDRFEQEKKNQLYLTKREHINKLKSPRHIKVSLIKVVNTKCEELNLHKARVKQTTKIFLNTSKKFNTKIPMPLIIQTINLIVFLSPLVISIKKEGGNILRKVQKCS